MSKKQLIYSILALFLIGLIVAGGTFAYYSFTATNDKNISFNTSKELQNYVIYNEGESKFSGDFKVSSTFTEGMHSTISLYKTSEAANVDLIATIKMDINEIGNNIKNSKALKWIVTEGDSTNVGNILSQGNFIGSNNNDTLTLVPNLVVTTTETFYTIWLWLDSNEFPSDNLTGETLDVNVWTEISQVEGIEESFTITRLNANYQYISATVVNNKHKVVGYNITTTNDTPSNWNSISLTEQSNVYNLNQTVLIPGTYYIWFKSDDNKIVSRSVIVTSVDNVAPEIELDADNTHVVVTATDNGSGLSGIYGYKLSTSNICDNTVTGFENKTSNTYNYTLPESDLYYICVKTTDVAGNVAYKLSNQISNLVVTLNPSGGSVSPEKKFVKYGENYGILPTPTKTGYSFMGWTLNEEAYYIPSEYQEVEYLQSTGTQYILTDIIPKDKYGAYVKGSYMATSNNNMFFGSKGSDDSRFWIYSTNNNIYFGFNTNLTTSTSTINSINELKLNFLNDRKTYFNGVSTNNLSTVSFRGNTAPIAIFASNTAGSIGNKGSVKIYNLKISDEDKVIANFVPVYRISDNVAGLYDTINQKFYTNNGTGTFGIGNNVYDIITSSTNVKIENDHTAYAIFVDDIQPSATVTIDDSLWAPIATVNATDSGSGIKANYGFKMISNTTCDDTVEGFVDTYRSVYAFNDSLEKYVCVRVEDNAGNKKYILQNVPNTIFGYIGDEQTFTATQAGYYKIQAFGAQGGKALCNNSACNINSKGSFTSGYIYLNQNDKLYIHVGGAGLDGVKSNDVAGGYNGGGLGTWDHGDDEAAGSGGGATDIRLSTGAWDNDTGLNSRIMVAAGGGGSSWNTSSGGAGGTIIGQNASTAGTGGRQTAVSFGKGINGTGNGNGNGVAGGGGGYYGGNADPSTSGSTNNSAGGGSSFISGYAGVNAITSASDRTHMNNTLHYSNKYFIDSEMKAGISSGNGKVKISYVGSAPERVNTSLNNVRYIKDCASGNTVNTNKNWIELQAIKNGVNLAKGKTITGTSAAETGYEYSYAVDGIADVIDSSAGSHASTHASGLQCITVDLGSTYDLDEIAVWHWFNDGRTYNNNVTYVSSDNDTWIEAINSEIPETSNGKRVNAWSFENDKVLYNHIASLAKPDSSIKYSAVSSDSNGKGIYTLNATSNDNFPVHFFRGNVTNNNVIFAGFCWKIIRTTETGGVKMIYNGTPVNGECTNKTGANTQIATSAYNPSNAHSKYAGYMYDYNTVDSTIKTVVDNWYENNLLSYTNKLEDTVFCSDRSNFIDSYWDSRRRVAVTYLPISTCPQKQDAFTVSDTARGNGKLTYPVGLIDVDEVMMAGTLWNTQNTSYYLYTNLQYWTMSPYTVNYSAGSVVGDFFVDTTGRMGGNDTLSVKGVRPVVSLKAGTIYYGGDGTSSSPYVLEPQEEQSNVLYDRVAQNAVLDTSIDFSQVSSDTNGKGIYIFNSTKNDTYPVYYYRGAVTNNNVLFGGFCWKIIRTTGTGGTKLIYNGLPSNGKCTNTTGTSTQLSSTSAYEAGRYDKKYVGYMWDDNTVNSTAKTNIENWYASNMTSYTSKLEDTVFCNDRVINSENGNEVTYGAYDRIITNFTPSLGCTQKDDSFTVTETSTTNGKLAYPVGLLTADELMIAGAKWGVNNTTFYLYTNQYYWTMTPYCFNGASAYMYTVYNNGQSNYYYVSLSYGLRPVVSLKPGIQILSNGTGTADNPYIVIP